MIFLVCLLLDLVILDVMEGEGYIEFIKDWIGLYVMECVWMNKILVLIRFLVKYCSDHCPIIASLASNFLRKVNNFRFFSMWLQNTSCMKLINDFWTNICFGEKVLKCYGLKMGIEIFLFSMLWSRGEIILVGFIVYGLIMRLLRILNSLRIIFWTFIKIFMLSLFLMFRIQVIWKILLVLIFMS